ncbi:MAG TPA: hypothetical protein VEI51_05645 [Methanomicrobiales archaeon]|nr:hypothetical protein [Methanomicrobiales archaeon]
MKVMLLFAGGDPDLTVSAPESERKMQQMRRWGEWTEGLANQGILVSACAFTESGKVVSRNKVAEFRKGADDSSGYAVLEVPTEQDAVEIAGTAPHIVYGGTTVVRPCIEIPR